MVGTRYGGYDEKMIEKKFIIGIVLLIFTLIIFVYGRASNKMTKTKWCISLFVIGFIMGISDGITG